MRYYSWGRYTEEELEAFLVDDNFDEGTKKEMQEKLDDLRYFKVRQQKWKENFEESYLLELEHLKESIQNLKAIMPPAIKDGDLDPFYAMDAVLYHLESSYDDPDTWNASALC